MRNGARVVDLRDVFGPLLRAYPASEVTAIDLADFAEALVVNGVVAVGRSLVLSVLGILTWIFGQTQWLLKVKRVIDGD